MITKYTHLKLNEDYPVGIAGYYVPEKEVRLKYNGREILYVTGQAIVESSCYSDSCGSIRKVYAIVPGFIVNWQNSKNKDGLPVSEVELISHAEPQASIRKIIESRENASPIGFW